MKIIKDFNAFGCFIPKGSEYETTESCAIIVRWDESKGMTFSKKAMFQRPRKGMPIALLECEYAEQ